jgi:hypothetical protein
MQPHPVVSLQHERVKVKEQVDDENEYHHCGVGFDPNHYG